MTGYSKTTNESPPITRRCAHKNCIKQGLFRAPFNTEHPVEHIWLCLEHVREHNAKWDYLAGKTPNEIEKEIRRATVWERPTWPFGKGPFSTKKTHRNGQTAKGPQTPPNIRCALGALGFHEEVTINTIKARYRVLAKKYHPDANGGSEADIDKFQEIQQAFATLQNYYARTQKAQNKTKDERS